MASALVLGCNGQDGTYLCQHLLKRGHTVTGIARQTHSRFDYSSQPFSFVPMDLAQGPSDLAQLLKAVRPDLVFHVAAVHASASTTQYEPVFDAMLNVNVASMHAVLEYLRLHNPRARALYASSAKVFGSPLPSQISEETARVSTCLYSITKNAVSDALDYYRRVHGSRASQLYLFNHESALRPESFFIPKLARAFAAAELGKPFHERFATLDFSCDWGSAEEYMDIAIDCIELAPGEDFVLASGRCLHARELVRSVSEARNVSLDGVLATPEQTPGQRPYHVSTAKLKDRIERTPTERIEALLHRLIDNLVQ